MELTSKKFNVPRVRGLPSSRRAAVALAAGCALAAGVVLLIALSHYKESVSLANKQETVLVATGTIQKGTAAGLVAQQQLYKPTPVLVKNLAAGAITNAAAIHGEVAVQDILPGQQLTVSDFGPASGGIIGQLGRAQRALSLSLDSAHGLVGELQTGDRVDVYADFNGPSGGAGSSASNGGAAVVKLLVPNALVLKAPSASSGLGASGQSAPVVLAVNDDQVGALAYAAENGKIWLALRPGGASAAPQNLTTFNSVVFGTGGKS